MRILLLLHFWVYMAAIDALPRELLEIVFITFDGKYLVLLCTVCKKWSNIGTPKVAIDEKSCILRTVAAPSSNTFYGISELAARPLS